MPSPSNFLWLIVPSFVFKINKKCRFLLFNSILLSLLATMFQKCRRLSEYVLKVAFGPHFW